MFGAYFNVLINLKDVTDDAFKDQVSGGTGRAYREAWRLPWFPHVGPGGTWLACPCKGGMCLSDETVLQLLRVDKACLAERRPQGTAGAFFQGLCQGKWPGCLLAPPYSLLGALARAGSPGWAGLQHRQHVVSESSCWTV